MANPATAPNARMTPDALAHAGALWQSGMTMEEILDSLYDEFRIHTTKGNLQYWVEKNRDLFPPRTRKEIGALISRSMKRSADRPHTQTILKGTSKTSMKPKPKVDFEW